MVVIIDTAKGQSYNFTTRKDAGEFIGVSLPTLRSWLAKPFYLYKTLIITNTTHEKVKKSNRALLKRHMAKIRQDEIDRVATIHVQGSFDHIGDIPINGSRPEKPAVMGRD